jgi:hypothetical protein
MESIIPFLVFFAFISLSCNALQFYLFRHPKKKPQPTITAEDLLHDLTTRGRAILKVDVIDPANLLLRSSKH